MRLVFATHNAGKLQEVKELLEPKYEVIGLSELGDLEDIPENEPTLEGNALVKAKTIWEKYGLSCFSDDTGLEIEALNGAPGVYSARYGGPEKDPEQNMDRILEELAGQQNRAAQFRTAVALILNGEEHLFEGVVKGAIRKERSGSKGFGYDPVFQPEGYSITFAEMDSAEKGKISHRGRAMAKLVEFLAAK
mgnify:CR=1 FL=1